MAIAIQHHAAIRGNRNLARSHRIALALQEIRVQALQIKRAYRQRDEPNGKQARDQCNTPGNDMNLKQFSA
jgi:hypothetical protein